MKFYNNIFSQIVSLDNLFSAWDEFKRDKKKKLDVQRFELGLEENIFRLYREFKNKTYRHGSYSSFYLQDPKQRHIHKAQVKDRVLHHAIFAKVNPIFEETFIPYSFSCRINKGTHKGVAALAKALRQVSHNNHKPCFALKCDIKKFFESVDHDILLSIIRRRIKDKDVLWLLQEVIEGFISSQSNLFERRGLPIGNLTSQLFANVYMNEFDQFVKHKLKVKHYFRYTDDFVIVSDNVMYLKELIPHIKSFLNVQLKLNLHPKKVSIRKLKQGIDFLGYITLPYHSALRTKTRRRVFNKLRQRVAEYRSGIISEKTLEQSLKSYLGVLSHADAYELSENLKNQFWFWLKS